MYYTTFVLKMQEKFSVAEKKYKPPQIGKE